MEYRTNKVLSHVGLSVERVRRFIAWLQSKKWSKDKIADWAMWATILAVGAHITIQHVYQVKILAEIL